MPPRKRQPRKPRAYCPGSGKPPVQWDHGDNNRACSKCWRDVRVKTDGTTFSHYAKAPVDRSDPEHHKRVLKTYGITGEEYEAILEAQGGVCYICQKPPRSKRLAVDHDHALGNTREAVRGALCRRCNHRLLGSANDATAMLYRAIAYLESPPARAVLL